MKTTAALAILAFALSLHGQNKAPAPARKPIPKAEAAPKPENQNVYYQSWDDGEIKSCKTYSGQPYLLICDGDKLDWKESFLNLIGNNAGAGMTDEQSYHRAFLYALAHSKQFLVSFSQEAWPKPQDGLKLTIWDCTKEKKITCKNPGREK